MTQVSPAPVSQIGFDKPKKSKDPLATNPTQQRPSIQPPQVIGRDTLLNALHKVYPLAAVFTVVPGFQTTQCVTLSTDPLIPKLLTSLYDAKYCKMSEEELKAAVESLQWLSIIYGPDRTNRPEEGLVRGYKRGTGPNGIINGPDHSSTLLCGTSSEYFVN